MEDGQMVDPDPVDQFQDDPYTGAMGGVDLGESLVEELAPVTTELTPGSGSSPFAGPGAAPDPAKARHGFRGLFAKKQKEEDPLGEDPEPKKKRAKVTSIGRRVSTADTLADVWAGLGSTAMRSGYVPTGRMMQFQSQVAGEMLDEAVKGSVIDRKILQPVVKSRGRYDLISAVFGPPMLVLAIERDPSKAELLIPLLKAQIRSSLPLMLPAIKKVQEKERKAAEAAAQMFPDLPEGEDPVDAIIEMLFAGINVPATATIIPDPVPEDVQL